MSWIIPVLAILLIAIIGYVYLAVTCFLTAATFLAAYRVEKRRSGSHQASLLAAMKVFHGRAPFNSLSDQDVIRLAGLFSVVPDPRAVAEIWRRIDRSRNASQLKDPAFLNRLEAEYGELAGQ